jgi:ribonuclease H2 subunit C
LLTDHCLPQTDREQPTSAAAEGCRGVLAATSATQEPPRRPEEAEVIDLDAEIPQGTLQVQAEFDEMVVWGHEAAVDGAADPYLRGVDEWLALADKVR